VNFADYLPPEKARVVLPLVLAACYAYYHWWRWRMMHPKINLDELPEPASEVIPVMFGESAGRMSRAERAAARQVGNASAADQAALDLAAQRTARQAIGQEEERLDFEAFDPDCIMRAFRRAYKRRPECFVQLGEYAWYRGAMVEAHFWVSMAKYRGVEGLDEWLVEIRRRWMQAGRPDEEENVYPQFPFQRGELARAHLMIMSGINVRASFEFIESMALEGNRDARLIRSQFGGRVAEP